MKNITNVTKKAKKGFKTRPVKGVKIFLKKKKKKKHQYCREYNKYLFKDQKQKLVEYRSNYCLTNEKLLLGCSITLQFFAILE